MDLNYLKFNYDSLNHETHRHCLLSYRLDHHWTLVENASEEDCLSTLWKTKNSIKSLHSNNKANINSRPIHRNFKINVNCYVQGWRFSFFFFHETFYSWVNVHGEDLYFFVQPAIVSIRSVNAAVNFGKRDSYLHSLMITMSHIFLLFLG